MSEKETNQEQESQVAKIDDLPVSQSELDEVRGGPIIGVEYIFATGPSISPATTTTRPPDGGGFINNHNETTVSDEEPLLLADLEPVGDVKGGNATWTGAITLDSNTSIGAATKNDGFADIISGSGLGLNLT